MSRRLEAWADRELRRQACARALSGVEDPEGAVRALVEAARATLPAMEVTDTAPEHVLREALAPFLSARARNDETEEPSDA